MPDVKGEPEVPDFGFSDVPDFAGPSPVLDGIPVTDPVDELVPPAGPEKGGLAGYLYENSEVLDRVAKIVDGTASPNDELTSKQVEKLCTFLEQYGKEGFTVDVFAAELRILESDFIVLAEKYPKLQRSAQLLAVNRKRAILTDLIRQASKSPAAAKELMNNPEYSSGEFLKQMAAAKIGDVRARAEKALQAKGVEPKEYLQVHVHVGDLRDEADATEGLTSAEDVLKELSNDV